MIMMVMTCTMTPYNLLNIFRAWVKRYDVHYKIDDAIQSDVREMKIRPSNKTKKKKQQLQQKNKTVASKKTPPKKQGSGSKKRGANSSGNNVVKSPASKKKRGRPAGSGSSSNTKKKKGKSVVEEESLVKNDFSLDEGDPPWRISGHEYISRKIKWKQEPDGVEAIGTVVGWIAETDVDSEGNPGFVSSITDKPAKLFHAVFDDFEQDFEEWELEECLM
jgi:hypothetical protein